ncbi:Protein arginine N-methyltransferase 3, partial [Stegodyphus mimosarum]
MGYFLLFEGMLDSVLFARDKFLAPGGYMFPDRCTLSLMAVCDLEKYNEYVNFWDNVYGFKMTAMKKDVIKEANVEAVKAEVACSEPVVVKELDIMQCKADDADFSSVFDLVMNRTCSVTAIVGYFDSYFERGLSHKVILSTSPKSTSTHWKQTMFLLPNPVQVTEGEVVNCRLSCRKNRRDPRSLIVKLNFGKYHNQYYLS